MPLNQITRELHEAFNFKVFFDRDEGAAFASFGPLETTISVTTFKEAGAIIPIKDPDAVDFANVTLERGASRNPAFYNWLQDVLDVLDGAGAGLPIPNTYKRNVILYQYDRRKTVIKRYIIYGAFPVAMRAGTWDNSRDEVVIESLTLAFDFYTMNVANNDQEAATL